MVFGQQGGPPASARQLQELLGLLIEAGHTGFRDARGPLGFNQRQSAGKFTRDEAAAYIEQLQQPEADETAPNQTARNQTAPDQAAPAGTAPSTRLSADEQALHQVPAEALAAELQRRGWLVIEPLDPTGPR
jgi:hypothetical protein